VIINYLRVGLSKGDIHPPQSFLHIAWNDTRFDSHKDKWFM
jgi:hypothetical protein